MDTNTKLKRCIEELIPIADQMKAENPNVRYFVKGSINTHDRSINVSVSCNPHDGHTHYYESVLEDHNSIYEKGCFSIDEAIDGFEGWYNPGYDWYGFYAPYFEQDTAMELVEAVNNDELSNTSLVVNHDHSISLIDTESDKTITLELETIVTPEGSKRVYAFALDWCWLVDEPEPTNYMCPSM